MLYNGMCRVTLSSQNHWQVLSNTPFMGYWDSICHVNVGPVWHDTLFEIFLLCDISHALSFRAHNMGGILGGESLGD